ncbi:MAG: quinoprotein glucose dehydrogenase, partial [Gammaproteobacteria bacterium]
MKYFDKAKISFFPLAIFLTASLSACDNYEDPKKSSSSPQVRESSSYLNYGGDGGRQYANGNLITRDNINALKPMWSYHTGEVSTGSKKVPATTAFEVTPILAEGILYFCTPYNRVVALDPATGAEFWSYNPKINLKSHYSNQLVCRGVSFWKDTTRSDSETCASRIFSSTNDTRLLSIDAKTGELCPDFGKSGIVDISKGPGEARYAGAYHHTSPPTVIGDKIVIGGSVSDGEGTRAPSGVVRAFDARNGKLIWAQDMAPPGFDYRGDNVSDSGYALATPNVWAPMVADESLNIIYAPTGNPLPDYFRDSKHNMSHYGSSVVAINGDTGDIVWHYQFVHNDFWDFDTPAQPTLFELQRDG